MHSRLNTIILLSGNSVENLVTQKITYSSILSQVAEVVALAISVPTQLLTGE